MLFLALVIGIVAGLRAFTAPAAIAWAASAGTAVLDNSPLVFLAWRYTPWVLTLLAGVELITDQLPTTPSRKMPVPFGTRLVCGGLSGAAIGVDQAAGLALGFAGAVIGTLGGAAARARLAVIFGRDRPAALLEDTVAIGAAILVALSL
jgi:uncharacterized membrane protein